jgi:hypothetical protein
MTLPLNHSKDRAELLEAEIFELVLQAKRKGIRIDRDKLNQCIKRLEEEEFNTQSTDSGG